MMCSTRHRVFHASNPGIPADPLIGDPAGCRPIGHHGAVEAGERDELVGLVRLIQAGDGSEAEIDAALGLLARRVPHPRVSGLIFWPRHEGFDRDLTAEEIVAAALAYRPFAL